jgi:hypothetical protein
MHLAEVVLPWLSADEAEESLLQATGARRRRSSTSSSEMTTAEPVRHPGRYNPAHGKNHRSNRGRDSAVAGGPGAAGRGDYRAQSSQASPAEEERGHQGEDGRGAAGPVGEGEGREAMKAGGADKQHQ